MKGWQRARAPCAALLGAALLGCAGAPVAPGGMNDVPAPSSSPSPPVVVQAPEAAFESRLRERALALERRGALGDAALAWEILLALRPEQADYRQHLADLRERIGQAVDEHTQRARQARSRGDFTAAARHYLAVLALDPSEREAKEGLRAIERMRSEDD